MCFGFDPFRLLLISASGWMSQQQLDVIDYLREENRVLRQQLGGKRIRLSDEQRCRRLGITGSHAYSVYIRLVMAARRASSAYFTARLLIYKMKFYSTRLRWRSKVRYHR